MNPWNTEADPVPWAPFEGRGDAHRNQETHDGRARDTRRRRGLSRLGTGHRGAEDARPPQEGTRADARAASTASPASTAGPCRPPPTPRRRQAARLQRQAAPHRKVAPHRQGSAAPAGSAVAPGLSKFDATKLGTLDARLEALRLRVEERQKTLDARRQAERERIRIRWGSVVQQPAVVQALQLHAFRVARLERIQELAQVEAKPAVAARASKALDRESVRHERTMAALASGAAAPPVPPAGGAR